MLRILLFSLFLVAVSAQENTCPALTACIQGNSQQQLGMDPNNLRQRRRLGNCGQSEVQKMANMLQQLQTKRQQRMQRVAQCIQGLNNGNMGFAGCALPTGNIARTCRRQNNRQGKCKQYQCGCPEAKICHECYELSALHDEIHGLKMQLDKTRIECRAAGQNGNERGPQNDESLVYALSN